MSTRINVLEEQFHLRFSQRHRSAIEDSSDPIHQRCDFLVAESPFELLRFKDVNETLHQLELNRWPTFLVAFASNGCGDYFAYDLRAAPPKVIYMDPDHTVEENLNSDDIFWFPTFDAWYAYMSKASVGA